MYHGEESCTVKCVTHSSVSLAPEEKKSARKEARRFTRASDERRATSDERRRMKIPTYDAKPGSKAYSGLGERLMSAMGWSRCVESDE